MRSVATLFWLSFTGTRLSSALSIAGLVLLGIGTALQIAVPSWTLDGGMRSDLALGQQALMLLTPWFAVFALFLATSAQPRVIRGLVFGHAATVLPHVRLTALVGAILVAAVVALAAAAPAALFFVDYPIAVDSGAIFRRSFAIAFVNFGLLYPAFWALAYIRGYWYFVGPALIVVAITVPAAFLNEPGAAFDWRMLVGTTGWIAYTVLILAGDRISHRYARWRRSRGQARGGPVHAPATEAAATVLLGADRPWIGVVVPCVTVALVLWIVPDRDIQAVVLASLVLLTAVSGARAVGAAARSRSLWLRTDAAITALFGSAERAFWRQNAYSLGAAVLVFAGLGAVMGYSPLPIGSGVVLLVLATSAGLYLGLSMTRGLPLGDAAMATATMGLIVFAALVAGHDQQVTARLLACGAVLLVVTIGLRQLARARWSILDWMRCRRPERS